MTRILVLALALLSLHASAAEVERVTRGNLAMEGIPEIPQELQQRMRRYQFARGASFEDWTPDGRITISTRFGNTNQLHVVDVPMGARRQLTFFDEPVNSGSWSPTGARKGVAYVRDAGGDENYQLEYLDPAAADPVRLTDGRGRAGTGAWSPDGTRYAFHWTARTGVVSDVYVDDPLDRRAPELVFEAPEVGWNAVDWSPDGKSLLLIHFVSVNESYLWTYDLATREKREIEPAKVKAARGGYFSRDGKGVYITSDLGSEFRTLRYVDLASGKVTPLTDHLKWEIEDFGLSKDGRYLAYVANEDGASRLGVMDLVQKADLILPALPFGVIGSLGFDRESKRLAFDMETPNTPSDVWVWTVADGKLERWTESEIGPIDAKSLVEPTLVHYPTFDKVNGKTREIPAWLYKPAGAGPHPVLISIHGGPEGQSRPVFSTNVQQWAAELGYAVILPNVRGSSGYGKTYVALDNGMKREDSVRDIGALLDWIGDAARSRRQAHRADRRLLRRLHGAGVHDALQRPAARRRRHRRHQQLRHLPREHRRVPARPAPARVWRRARPEDARFLREDLAAQQRGQDHEAHAGHPGQERPARAVHGIRAVRREDPRQRRRGLVPRRAQRGARLRQARQHRLLPVDGGDVPGEVEAVAGGDGHFCGRPQK